MARTPIGRTARSKHSVSLDVDLPGAAYYPARSP